MNSGKAVGWLAALSAVAAVFLAFLPSTAEGMNCGSLILKSGAAGIVEACAAARTRLFPAISVLLALALVLAAVAFYLVRNNNEEQGVIADSTFAPDGDFSHELTTLTEKFAAGEISEDEFASRRERLIDSGDG